MTLLEKVKDFFGIRWQSSIFNDYVDRQMSGRKPVFLISEEERVKVYVNKTETEYAEFYSEGNIDIIKIPQIIKMNVTATNIDIKATLDLEVDPVTLITVNGVPDYEETARRVIQYLSTGIALDMEYKESK